MMQEDGNSSSDEELAEPTRDEPSEPLPNPPEKIDDVCIIVDSQEAPPPDPSITKPASVSKSGSQKIHDLQLELYRLHQEIKRRSSTQVMFRNF